MVDRLAARFPLLHFCIFSRNPDKKGLKEVCVGIEKFIEFERARRDCYKLLAACFYQPQKELFLEEEVFINLTNLLKPICPEAAVFSEEMGSAVFKYSNEDLLVEYARLFVGPSVLLAPPYGSLYLEEGGKVMGETTVKVLEVYKVEGLSLDEHFKNLPDHIAAELEFMFYLAFNEVEALENNNIEKAVYFLNKQRSFKQTFLGRWAVPFCEKIKQGTENEFYNALADCLAVYITKTGSSDVMPVELKDSLALISI